MADRNGEFAARIAAVNSGTPASISNPTSETNTKRVTIANGTGKARDSEFAQRINNLGIPNQNYSIGFREKATLNGNTDSSFTAYLSGKNKYGSSSAWYDAASEEQKEKQSFVESLQKQVEDARKRGRTRWHETKEENTGKLNRASATWGAENWDRDSKTVEELETELSKAQKELEIATDNLKYATEWRHYDADMEWMDTVKNSGQDWGFVSDNLGTMASNLSAAYDDKFKALAQAQKNNEDLDKLRRQGGIPAEVGIAYTPPAEIAKMEAELAQIGDLRDMANRRYSYSLDELATDKQAVERGALMSQHLLTMDAQNAERNMEEYVQNHVKGDTLGALRESYRNDKSAYRPTEEWNDTQRNRYYVLLDRQGEQAANDYAVNVNSYINATKEQEASQQHYDWGYGADATGWGKLARGAAGIGATVAGMPGELGEYINKLERVAYTGAYVGDGELKLHDIAGAITQGRADKLNELGTVAGKGLGDIYQLTNSMAQSLVYGNMVGSAGTLALFFGSAANQGFDDAMSRGATPEQALAFGALSGVAEAAAELVPLDNLLNADKALTRGFLKSAMIQAGLEGLEEGETNVMNMLADELVMGDKSAMNQAIQERMAAGESYEDAARAEWGNFVKDTVWSMLGGAISGAGSSAIQHGIVMGSKYKSDEDGSNSIYGATAAQLGREAAAVTDNQKLSDLGKKVEAKAEKGGKITNYTAKKLAEGTNRVSIVNAAEQQVKERVPELNDKDARALANAIVSESRGEKNGPGNQKLIEKHRDIADTLLNELGKNGEVAEWAQKIGVRGVESIKYGDKDREDLLRTLEADKNKIDADAPTIVEADMSADVTIGDVSGTVSGLKLSNGKPKFAVTNSEGKEQYVNVDEAISSGALPAGMARLAYESLGLGDAATDVYNLYNAGQNVSEYVAAMDEAISIAADVSKREAFDKSETVQSLTAEQKDFAWNFGQQQRTEKQESRKANKDGKRKPAKAGTVSFDGVTINGTTYKATSKDKVKAADLRVIERIAKAANVDVVFYESDSIDGMYQGANGFYRNGTVYLDVHAAASKTTQQDAILLTAAHELTHHIRLNAEAQYDALKEFVVEHLLEQGMDFETMVQDKLKEKGMKRSDAVEEVVADACEMVLKDSKAVEKLAKENKSLAQTIADWLRGFYEDIKAAFEGVEARSKEAKAMTDYMDELVKLWDDALIEASKGESKQSEKTKASYAGRNLYKDSSVYDYDFMVSQPDMVVHELPPLDVVKTGAKIDHKKVVELGLANAAEIGRKENGEVYAVKNAYTQKEIMVGAHGLNHGLDGNNIGRIRTNARLSAIGGYIVQNAIPINGRKNKNRQANGTYAMACLVKSGDVDVVAIVTVEEHTAKAVDIDFVDVTHSIGGRLRKNKESSQSSTREKGYGLKAAPNEATFTISIADFLDIVNETHKSILSEDVLKHFGETRPENGVFTGDVLFSRRDSSEGLTKEEARAQAQAYTRLKAENAALQRRLEYWQGQTKRTKQRTINRGDVDKYAKQLIKMHGSTVDEAWLKQKLREMGDYLVQTDEPDYRVLNQMAWEISTAVIENSEAEDDSGAYDNRDAIMSDIKGYTFRLNEMYKSDLPEGFRKQYSGKLHISYQSGLDVDVAYRELQETYGTSLFPEMSAPPDMLVMIADAYDTVSAPPAIYNPYQYHMNEAITSVSYDILDMMMSEDIRQTSPTMADKADAKLQQQKAADKRKLNQVRADKNARITEIRREETAKRKEAVAKEKAAKYDRVKAVREYYQGVIQRQREARRESTAAKKYRDNVYDKVSTLMNWLIKNSDKEHVPEALKAPLVDFLSSIDLTSKQKLKGGEATFKDNKYVDALEAIQRLAANQQKYLESGESTETLDMFLDFGDLADFMVDHRDAIKEILQGKTDVDTVGAIAYMNAAQLQDLDHILTVLTTAIRKANKFLTDSHYASVIEASKAARDAVDAMKPDDVRRILGKEGADRFLAWSNTIPYYAFKRFGEAGSERFEAFIMGWAKMAMNIKAIQDFTKGVYDAEQVKAWEGEIHDFEIRGQKFSMSTAQIMGLYCSSKREQALKHLDVGGMRIGNIETKGKLLKQSIQQKGTVHLNPIEMTEVLGVLSEEQIKVADELQKFMNTTCSAWGNEVSMERFGYRQFTESNYYPIKSVEQNLDLKDTKAEETSLFRLINMSATKALNPNANNAILINSIFDVFAAHSADMAKYNGLALPVLDMVKWYNYREKSFNEFGHMDTFSVHKSIEATFGTNATRYIGNFIKDLNGVRSGGRDEGLLKGFMGRYKAAAVALNTRVIVQQPTSIVRAAYMINSKYLMQGATMKGGAKEAMKYSGLAQWKSMGFFDTNIARGVTEQIKDAGSAVDKARDLSMKGAEKADEITWGTIWNACKLEQMDKGLEGKELMEATTRRFNEVIVSTQVMDSTITRSDLMRSDSLMMKELTSFKSEPTVSYNILLDSAMELILEYKRTGSITEARKRAWPFMWRAGMVYVTGQIATAAAAAIVDALRDDDEYQDYISKWLEHLEQNIFEGANPINLLPILGEAINIALGKETHDSMLFQPLTQLSKAATAAQDLWRTWFNSEQELNDPNRTNWGRLYQIAQAVSSISGLPVASGMREFKMVWNMGGRLTTGKTILKTYDSGIKNEVKYALQDGYIDEEKAVALLTASGEYDNPDDIYWQVQEWLHADDSEWTRYNDVYAAIKAKDKNAFTAAQEALGDHGIAPKSVRAEAKRWIGRQFVGEEGIPASMDEKTALAALQDFAGLTKIESQHLIDEWKFEKDTGFEWSELKDEYVAGTFDAKTTQRYLETFGHEYSQDAKEKVLEWTCEKDTGVAFSDLCDAFIHGELTAEQTQKYLEKYGGETPGDAAAKVAQWSLAPEFGIKYSSTDAGIKKALIEGYISDETAKAIMVTYGGKSWEEAEDYVNQYHFTEETGYAWSEIEEAYADGIITYDEMVNWFVEASLYTHGSVEIAEEYARVADWKKNIPDADSINRTALEKWDTKGDYMQRAGLNEIDFTDAWSLYSSSYSQYDANGNKVKEKAQVFFEKLYNLMLQGVYTEDEIDAIARTVYSKSYVNKYAMW